MNICLAEQKIDFLSVDVEGRDLDVLQSNDWEIFRPNIVLVELLESTIEELREDLVAIFLKGKGYIIYAKCVHTVLFRDDR